MEVDPQSVNREIISAVRMRVGDSRLLEILELLTGW